ncbi:MAG: hypothetical protein LBE76_00045 [Nitrososphaerota archaeon]|jgi:hypothetical protein|nr:hypothetical protein [Nitrososphaerota archaeon]
MSLKIDENDFIGVNNLNINYNMILQRECNYGTYAKTDKNRGSAKHRQYTAIQQYIK